MSTETIHIETKKQLVPELRFGEFYGEWKRKKIGNIAELTSSKRVYLNDYVEVGIPFYRGKEISELRLGKTPDDILYITETSYNEFKSKFGVPQKEDILITAVGTLGNVLRIKNDDQFYFKDGNLIWFRKIKELSHFLEISLEYYKREIEKTSIGSTQRALTMVELRKLLFPFPSLPEQQKIASFLSAVDEKIQQLTQKKELLEQYKKGVMQQLFSGKLRFKDENGKNYPDWEEKRLGAIAIKVNKKNRDNSVNYVLTNSATQGIVSQSDYFDREIANQNNLEGYYVVEINDFVYNPRISVHAPVGPVKRNKLKEGVMSPLYTVFRFKGGDLDYLECFFSTIVWHKYLNSVANFGARHDRMNISQEDFFRMPIPFPCKEEQQKIATYLSSIDTKIDSVNQQITQTQTFKKGLLQKMFV